MSMSINVKETHVAVFAFPFASHPAAILTLVKRLASSAPNTTFSFLSSAIANQKSFPTPIVLEGYKNIKSYNVNDGIPKNHVVSGNPLEPIGLFLKATPDNFVECLEEVVASTGVKVTCLLTDAIFGFSGEWARKMGVPWVAFWTCGPSAFLMHICTDDIRTMLGLNGDKKNKDQTIDFLQGILSTDLPLEVTGNLEEPFARLLYNMGTEVPRATAIALNSFEEMDPIATKELKSKAKKVLNVGFNTMASPPPSYSDDDGCLLWLDNHEKGSVAYLSFGSILTPPPPELEAIVEALEATRVPFIWSIRDSSPGNPLLEGLLERIGRLGKKVSWAPQLQILGHSSVGAFVTHCGWNSIAESIAGGVPMICRPYFGDQKLNRAFVEDVWKIGVRVEGDVFTKKGMMDALDIVLSRVNGERFRENIRVLKEKAIVAVGNNGSSTRNFETLVEVVTTIKDS